MDISIEERDALNALSLYLATKRTALRGALNLRAPLTSEEAEDLRIHYSNYFICLFSGIDVLGGTSSMMGGNFKKKLNMAFRSCSEPESEDNYSYIRELRNGIVHRGLDIASQAHFDATFPLLVAPPAVSNRDGTKNFAAFGFYLLEIIKVCEMTVGPTIEAHLDSVGVLNKEIDKKSWGDESRHLIKYSQAIPTVFKNIALESLNSLDLAMLHQIRVEKLRELLKPIEFRMPSDATLITTWGSRRP